MPEPPFLELGVEEQGPPFVDDQQALPGSEPVQELEDAKHRVRRLQSPNVENGRLGGAHGASVPEGRAEPYDLRHRWGGSAAERQTEEDDRQDDQDVEPRDPAQALPRRRGARGEPARARPQDEIVQSAERER